MTDNTKPDEITRPVRIAPDFDHGNNPSALAEDASPKKQWQIPEWLIEFVQEPVKEPDPAVAGADKNAGSEEQEDTAVPVFSEIAEWQPLQQGPETAQEPEPAVASADEIMTSVEHEEMAVPVLPQTDGVQPLHEAPEIDRKPDIAIAIPDEKAMEETEIGVPVSSITAECQQQEEVLETEAECASEQNVFDANLLNSLLTNKDYAHLCEYLKPLHLETNEKALLVTKLRSHLLMDERSSCLWELYENLK